MLNVEIIKGSSDTFDKQEKFENMVNQFLRGHDVVNVEYKAYPVNTGREIREFQIAYITYNDDLGTGWESLFNHMSSNGYDIKDILKAALKASDVTVSNTTIEQIANHYWNKDLIGNLAYKLGIEVKKESNL